MTDTDRQQIQGLKEIVERQIRELTDERRENAKLQDEIQRLARQNVGLEKERDQLTDSLLAIGCQVSQGTDPTWSRASLEQSADKILAYGLFQDDGEQTSREQLVEALDDWLGEVVSTLLGDIIYFTYDGGSRNLPSFVDCLATVKRMGPRETKAANVS